MATKIFKTLVKLSQNNMAPIFLKKFYQNKMPSKKIQSVHQNKMATNEKTKVLNVNIFCGPTD